MKITTRCAALLGGAMVVAAIGFGLIPRAAHAAPATQPSIDLGTQKTLYVVGYAHLDTQWRWAYPLVIREFLANTLHDNFALIEKYPDYVFNFSGSRRYRMMKEYYPKEYEQLKKYIAQGRWFTCGSSVDENDANVPSAESQIRHILYGNHFFRDEFGVQSNEFMLPDCFGFPAALPSILHHCGIRGFSTQKLTWGSAVGIPFKVGVWEGVDGEGVIAALDPGAYVGRVQEDLSQNKSWLERINNTGKLSGVYADYHYFGTGDRGGAPAAESVDWVEKSLKGGGPVCVVSSTAERMFNDITDAQRAKLPRYKGELLLTEHSAGSITSEGYMKRWNRKNEQLADAAERASVAAAWLTSASSVEPGGAAYPSQRLLDAWYLVLGSQMHDMLPGTSLPKCYEYCWNDELLAANQFSAIATDGVGVVASQMDTRGPGVSLVVYNPLSIEREDVVEATVSVKGEVSVVGPDGKRVPAQVIGEDHGATKIAFLANVPSVGFATFNVQPSEEQRGASELKASDKSIENDRLRVTLNDAGDIASIFDKRNNRESLAEPVRLAFLYENPAQFPAWNMDWNDRKNPPRSYVKGPAQVKVVERGPVRVTLEVTRQSEGSRFVQRISLATGAAGDHVNVNNTIDWQTQERSLKATFPLSVSNPKATYDIQVGALERPNNDPKKYEVPQHQWFDLTDTKGDYGVAVLNDCKFGSDKPADNTLRLTMVYTPGTRGGYRDQGTQDIGRHEITYAIAPHAGDWRQGKIAWAAKRLNQPLMAFTSPAHEGALGKSFSLVKTSSDQVSVEAIKKAEDSDEVVVRLRELTGNPAADVHVAAGTAIASAREVDGQERQIGAAKIQDGALVTDVKPYHLRAFALKLGAAPAKASVAEVQTVSLPYDVDAVSFDGNRKDGAFDTDGRTIAAEELPAKLSCDGISFVFGPKDDAAKNALAGRGQKIDLPAGYSRAYVLAAAIDGDQDATFKLGDREAHCRVQDWGGYIGQWDNRQWDKEAPETSQDVGAEMNGLVPGYVKPAEVAWFCSHRHHPEKGNEYYQYSYIYKYGFDIPDGATSITVPDNDKVRVFAISVAKNPHDNVTPARPLFDTLSDRAGESVASAASIEPDGGTFNDVTQVTVRHALYWKAGGLHYTTDGSEPTAQSPAYDGKPIRLASSAKLRVRQFDARGNGGPEASADFKVDDVTPPTVKSVSAVTIIPTMRIEFSEPLSKPDAERVGNYKLDPPVEITSAKLSDDGQNVTLELAKPIGASAATNGVRLAINGVKDASPAGNRIKSSEPIRVAVARPVYSLDAFNADGKSGKDQRVADLPIKSSDKWTVNFFVRTEKQPENRTVIAGFGRASDDAEDGSGRYLAKFDTGLHFWSRLRDVRTRRRTQLDLNAWQMLSATYDGQMLRLYKNGMLLNERPATLADDEPVVRIAPLDPWDQQRRFQGQIKNFTIWNSALTAEALRVLQDSGPMHGAGAATQEAEAK